MPIEEAKKRFPALPGEPDQVEGAVVRNHHVCDEHPMARRQCRDLDPNNPEDVKAWQERDRQAAEMLEPSPQVDPVMFEFLDDDSARPLMRRAAQTRRCSSRTSSVPADPKPRIVEHGCGSGQGSRCR